MTASNPLNNQTVTLWLKLESFAIGSLSTPPSQRLTVNVKRLFYRLTFLYITVKLRRVSQVM